MKRKIFILALAVIIAAASPAFSGGKAWNRIKPGKVYGMLKEGGGMWVVDVRDRMTYEKNHIEGSVNIPVIDLKYRNFPKTKMFVLVDGSPGLRYAEEAAAGMSDKGYGKIYVLEGGIKNWEFQGYPMVKGEGSEEKGVTAHDLKWALENAAPIIVYDLRDKKETAKGIIPGSRAVGGKDFKRRFENIKAVLRKKGGLFEKLKAPEMIVLVFPPTENAEKYSEILSAGIKKDVRYLRGGYETYNVFVKGGQGEKKTVGECPTCPKAE